MCINNITHPEILRKQFNIVNMVSDDKGVYFDKFSSLADDPDN